MADEIKETDAQPPDLAHNVWFWFWQAMYWIGYAMVTILYVPWAFVMHALILALAVPFAPLCCWRGGRKFFIYFYVITVMLPGKYIWFNTLVRTRRRGKVWDYEMGRPRPIPLDSRRRLSEDSGTSTKTSQSGSALLTKLPPEIRVLIYRQLFVGESKHLHIVQRKIERLKMKPPTVRIKSHLCAREHSDPKHAKCNCIIGAHAHNDPPLEEEIMLPVDYNRGKLALLQTCKQVYSEAIEQLYREPKFCFNNLDQPPFFLRSVLPRRLALIQRVQIVYKQGTMVQPREAGSSLAKYIHKVQQCTFCNLTSWLGLIQKYMTGVRQIEAFLYLDQKMPAPKLGQPWVVKLLALQRGPAGIRDMRMKVFCNFEDGSGSRSEYKKEVKDFTRACQKELRRVNGADQKKKQALARQATTESKAQAFSSSSNNNNTTEESTREAEFGSGVVTLTIDSG